MDLKRHRLNTVEQKIGRNLLLLQKIEYLLKYIVRHQNISAPISQFNKIEKEAESKLKTQTMGTVLQQHLNHLDISSDQKIENTNFESNLLHISFETEYNLSQDELKRKKVMLEEVLKERNNLVHHIIIDFDEDSHESCQDIEKKLDAQRDKILIALEDLQSNAKYINQFKKTLLNFIKSGKMYKEMYYLFLANNRPLIIEFVKISIKENNENWLSLAKAGKFVKENIPDEVAQLKSKYSHKTLKSLLSSENIFEVKEDKSKNMTLFRLKSDWKEYFKQHWKDF